jgi:hypothetical protein
VISFLIRASPFCMVCFFCISVRNKIYVAVAKVGAFLKQHLGE